MQVKFSACIASLLFLQVTHRKLPGPAGKISEAAFVCEMAKLFFLYVNQTT